MRQKLGIIKPAGSFLLLIIILIVSLAICQQSKRQKAFLEIQRLEQETLRVSIITDIDHCPSRRPVSEKQLSDFISFSSKETFDFVISLGDNASHRLRDCSETADMDARYIVQKIRSAGRPAYFVLGDHDLASDVSSYQTWLETSENESTFFSFDLANVHVIILDSVLGGESLSPPCEEIEYCQQLQKRLQQIKDIPFQKYLELYDDSVGQQKLEKRRIKTLLEEKQADISKTRSSGRRDIGRISQIQLDWLENDLANTAAEKILVFSDHPLFPFTSDRKSYNIVNGDKTREILKKSNKKIVCISGEAHLWHDEIIDGIQYYIIDEFKKANGSWASFVWDDKSYSLEKITH